MRTKQIGPKVEETGNAVIKTLFKKPKESISNISKEDNFMWKVGTEPSSFALVRPSENLDHEGIDI